MRVGKALSCMLRRLCGLRGGSGGEEARGYWIVQRWKTSALGTSVVLRCVCREARDRKRQEGAKLLEEMKL